MRHLEAARAPRSHGVRRPVKRPQRRRYSSATARLVHFRSLCSPRAPCMGNRAVPKRRHSGRLLHGAKHPGSPAADCAWGAKWEGRCARAGMKSRAPHLHRAEFDTVQAGGHLLLLLDVELDVQPSENYSAEQQNHQRVDDLVPVHGYLQCGF